MPKNKALCVEDLRHAEYYEMQNIFDDLYAKSKNGDIFTNLTNIILSRENILLAYRNIKARVRKKSWYHRQRKLLLPQKGKRN